MHFSKSPSAIAHMGILKRMMDPRGILNPGKLLVGLIML